MVDDVQEIHRCPACGCGCPDGCFVCPACHQVLVSSRDRAKPPRWMVALLLAIIASLAAYAGYLAWKILVLHQF